MKLRLGVLFEKECQSDVRVVQMFDINLPKEFDEMLTATTNENEKKKAMES
jgi:regulator of protease activity HflC (stomatin/prohibitin superfamily)